MYIDYDYFKTLYTDMSEAEFNLYAFEACRYLDVLTTGLDNVKKLKVAFPEGDDGEAVKRCVAKLTHELYMIQSATGVGGSSSSDNRRVASMSSGTESVSYASSLPTFYETAASDDEAKDKHVNKVVTSSLRGLQDANGVNLLYMGAYPNV